MGNELFNNITMEEGRIINSEWIEWIHFGVPDETGAVREMVKMYLQAFGHCLVCTSMDACYYAVKESPEYPFHPKCDCEYKRIPYSVVESEFGLIFDLEKFTKYIFDKTNKNNNGKFDLFTRWGYDINDSEMLIKEMSRQAKERFLKGEYIITGNTGHGTTIRIFMNLDGKTFWSGWQILPRGVIRCTTPYADK